MVSDYEYKNRILQMGLKISYYRKLRGLSQEDLAEKIGKSAGYVGMIEAPAVCKGVSLRTLFDIADALKIEPDTLLKFDA